MHIEDFYTRDDHNEGAEVRLLDKLGKETDCYLRVVGPDSDAWRSINADMQRNTLLASFGSPDKKSNAEMRAEYLSRAVLDSRGFDGEVDAERYKKLFICAPYITDQVDRFIAKRENFIKPSETK